MIGFADRYRALLLISQAIGIIERMIKQRLREASDAELFNLERQLWYRVNYLAKPEAARAVSLGRLKDLWFNHPFYKMLLVERDRRLTPLTEGISLMSDEDIRNYLINKAERHQNYSPKGKPLPVLPQRKPNEKR